MRKTVKSRIKTQNVKILQPFEQSLVSLILNRNKQALQQIMKYNYSNTSQLIKSIQLDLQLIDKHCKYYNKLKYLTMNAKVILFSKINRNQQASILIEKIIKKQNIIHNETTKIQKARSILNRCIILINLNNSKIFSESEIQQILKDIKQAITNLQTSNNISHKENLPKLINEIILYNFYIVIRQVSFIKTNKTIQQLYKKGYELSLKYLGKHNNFSKMLKKILRTSKSVTSNERQQSQDFHQKKLEKIQTLRPLNHIRSTLYGVKSFNNKHKGKFGKNYINKSKQQQLIQIRKKKNYTQSAMINPQQAQQMKQLEHIQKIYLPKKLPINFKQQYHYQSLSRNYKKQNIKDIIKLKFQFQGQNLNKTQACSQDKTVELIRLKTENNPIKSRLQDINIDVINTRQVQQLKQIKLKPIPIPIQSKIQQKQENCQLI